MSVILPECLDVQFGWVTYHQYQAGYERSNTLSSIDDLLSYRIRLVLAGTLEEVLNGACWPLTGGSLLCIATPPSAIPRVTRSPQASESITVGFRVLLFGSIDVTSTLADTHAWQPDPEVLETLAMQMGLLVKLAYAQTMGAQLIRDGAMRAIVGLCWDTLGADNIMEGARPQLPPWLNTVMQAIRHYPHITVLELEQLTGYSHAQFFRLFQQHVGISPRVYLLRHRLNLAKHLLRTTSMSVAAIAEHIGFCNASDFTRFFRRMSLVTPSEYRLNKVEQDMPWHVNAPPPQDYPNIMNGNA